MSANGRLTGSELTLVQPGLLPIFLANAAARAWFNLKAEYDRTHGDSLTIAAPVGGYRSYAIQADMHVRPELYGLSAYSTIPLAKAGYSTHGDGLAVDIADASKPSPRKTWLLASAARFGFTRQFGDADPNHYRLTSSTPAGTAPARIPEEENDMKLQFIQTKEDPAAKVDKTWVYGPAGIKHVESEYHLGLLQRLDAFQQDYPTTDGGFLPGEVAILNTYVQPQVAADVAVVEAAITAALADVDEQVAEQVLAKIDIPTAVENATATAKAVNDDAAQRMQS